MKRLIQTLLFASQLALSSTSVAEESKVPGASKPPARLTIQAELPRASSRSGVAAHFAAEVVYFWSTCATCAPVVEGALAVDIPVEARSKRRRVDVVGTKEHPVLWVRFGTDDKFYSMIVVGAPSGEAAEGKTATSPELVLKGWAGEKSPQKASLERGPDGSLTLELAQEPSFCGKSAPRETRVLRPLEGRFATVRASALPAKEREGAERREARVWSEPENALVALDAVGARSSSIPVDGDRKAPWSEAFDFTELGAPLGVDPGKWVIEFAAPLTEPTALYFVVSEKVYQLEFLPSSSKRYAVELGGEEGACVALVQPRTPAPLVEIMGTAQEKGSRTTAELVSELASGEPGIVDALLVFRGASAGREIARAFGKMSPPAQARAFSIVRKLAPEDGAPVYVRALEAGGEGEEALARLSALGPLGAAAVFARLKEGARGAEETLVAALLTLDAAFAARHLPLLLEEKQSEGRALFREALSGLAKDARAHGALSKWLRPEEMERLSPTAQIDLVRAIEPTLARLEGASAALARLSDSADFEGAYHLVPLVVKHHQTVDRAPAILRGWLSGEASRELDEEEKAALAVRVLESLLEHSDEGAGTSWSAALDESLRAENMRVRRGALLNLARDKEAARERATLLLELLTKDKWPQVRAAAALAIGPEPDGNFAPRAERVLLRRLKNDSDAKVRRALARAVSAARSDAIVSATRRSFESDADYLVRAEAAVSLGKLCDKASISALTTRARSLGTGLTEEGPIELGLASVTALALLTPDDINKRLAPLLSEKAPRLTRRQVLLRIEAAQALPGATRCSR